MPAVYFGDIVLNGELIHNFSLLPDQFVGCENCGVSYQTDLTIYCKASFERMVQEAVEENNEHR